MRCFFSAAVWQKAVVKQMGESSMKIGYARVSTDDQNLDLQMDALNKAGCEKIFTDHGVSNRR